jgi:hypothetical protein
LKWFKHISDSLDDPFIFDLMAQHGDAGYVIFFGILEIYAREFHPEDQWKLNISWDYLRSKLHRTRNKQIENILRFIQVKNKWEIVLTNSDVTIYIPKFRELLDDWTTRKVNKQPKNSVVTTEKLQKQEEADKDKEKDTDKERSKDSSKRTKKSSSLTDEQFFEYLSSNSAYQGIDIQTSKAKCEAWCIANNRLFTRRTFTNWLNREKPLTGGSNGNGTYSRGSAGKVTQGTQGARNLRDGEAYPVDCEETI